MMAAIMHLLMILVAVLVLAGISTAAPVEIGIYPASKIIEKGQDFTVNVSVDPVGNPITGAQFNLLFNGSVVEVKNVSEGNLFKQKGASTLFNPGILNNSEGSLINVWDLIIVPGANVTTKGTLATLTMNAKKTGTAGFNLSNVIVSDPASNATQVNVANSSVDIVQRAIVTVSNTKVKRGKAFSFTVSIDPQGTEIAGAQLNMLFNNSAININGVSEADFFKQNGRNTFFNGGTIDNQQGRVVNIFNAIIGPYNVSTPGTFITVNAVSTGKTGTFPINLSNVKIASPEALPVPFIINSGSVRIYPPHDVNQDDITDIRDLNEVGQHFNEETSYPYPAYDITEDGAVDIIDIVAVAQHFGEIT